MRLTGGNVVQMRGMRSGERVNVPAAHTTGTAEAPPVPSPDGDGVRQAGAHKPASVIPGVNGG